MTREEVEGIATLYLSDNHFESKIGTVEYIQRGEQPRIKIEVHGDWGELDMIVDVDRAERLRDSLNETLDIVRQAVDDWDGPNHLCNHCLQLITDEEEMVRVDDELPAEHYHPDCPTEPIPTADS